MSGARPIAVYTTVAAVDDARRIARELVERRLAACAHVAAIESFYTWDDALQHETEYRVMLKTTEGRYAEVEAAVLALHPYELPAVWAVAFEHVHAPYAAWVDESTR
jgi:periplasmic divalent cation tolerance protein